MPECLISNPRISDVQCSLAADGADAGNVSLRILFLVSAHNGLSQRAWIALSDLGHEEVVEVVDCAAAMEAAVSGYDPELIVCPFLKTMIPEKIWRNRPCLVVHPGPIGVAVGPREAVEIGLLDSTAGTSLREFWTQTRSLAERVANDGLHPARLEDKRSRRAHDERVKPLRAYRTEELAQCLECFFGPDPRYRYDRARRTFVYKGAAETARQETACLAI